MTEVMMALLRDMREARRRGFQFVALQGVHRNTIKAAMKHDWIFESPGLDGVRYSITGRGERDLALYEIPARVYRHDGICPACNIRPKYIRQTGELAPYCPECYRARSLQSMQTADYHPRSTICPTCGERPRMRRSNGRCYAYCTECRRSKRLNERKRRRASDLARVLAGEFLPCRDCHVNPRRVTRNSVQDYCTECHEKHKRERAFKKVMNPPAPRTKSEDACRRHGCNRPRHVSRRGFVYVYCLRHTREHSRKMYQKRLKNQSVSAGEWNDA